MQSVERSDQASAAIRTPDQRLRVFISSTLVEMAAERAAARTAVESLRLAPVMFELGARPHPPRDLYRAYLDQSDVFVGLYWERYGWVAPSEEVSGLEDEYDLAAELPRLIYVKKSETREPRLAELLGRIRADDRASYKYFSTAAELEELVEADLATLLAERFVQSRLMDDDGSTAPPAAEAFTAPLPAPLDSLVGRASEVRTITELLVDPAVRLVTLTGPGGIGKSRLAVEAARTTRTSFTDGTVFVALEAVRQADEVLVSIARALAVHDKGDGPISEALALALRHRTLLLVLDNFEQVLDAAADVTALLATTEGVTVLVTSRSPLRVRGERTIEIGPLALPAAEEEDPARALESPAVQLFVERARAARPEFELTSDNVAAVVEVCRKLDGLPLALELVAARIRLLSPSAMVERLDLQLGSLVGGGIRDLPTRQQTLLATVEWSTALLEPDEIRLLTRLGVFAGDFSLEAAESMPMDGTDRDVLTVLESLVDSSLVRQQDRGTDSYFTILSTVREWSRDQLARAGTLDQVRTHHANYYLDLSQRMELLLEGATQIQIARALADEHANLRASVSYFIESHQQDKAARLAWNLYVYWWIDGHLGEVGRWMRELLASDDAVTGVTRAIALYFTGAIGFWQQPEDVKPALSESAALFHEAHAPDGEGLALISLALALLTGNAPDPAEAARHLSTALELFRGSEDRWGEAMALVSLGRVALLTGDTAGALERFHSSLALTRVQHDEVGEEIALHHIGWVRFLTGSIDEAGTAFRQSLEAAVQLGHVEGIAYGLEGLVAVAAVANDVELAGTLLGAAESLRRQSGTYNSPTFSFHRQAVAPILASAAATQFESAREEGSRLSLGPLLSLVSQSSASSLVESEATDARP